MKLYYAPFTCSLSPHIALREAGLSFQLARVDLRTKTTDEGEDYRAINPKGYVPALRLDDGAVLSEGPAIVQYIADLKPEAKLAPPAGSFARYRLQEWLSFVSSELHKQFSPLFSPTQPAPQRARGERRIKQRLAHVEAQLAQGAYLLGDEFSVADIYLFVVLRWARQARLSLGEFSQLAAHLARIAERPAVAAAIAYETQAQAAGAFLRRTGQAR